MSRYFKEPNLFFKTLRFLNLMEPRKTVISLSKLFFYVTVFMMMWVMFNSPENLGAVLSTLCANTVATLNYMYRRHKSIEVIEDVPVQAPVEGEPPTP